MVNPLQLSLTCLVAITADLLHADRSHQQCTAEQNIAVFMQRQEQTKWHDNTLITISVNDTMPTIPSTPTILSVRRTSTEEATLVNEIALFVLIALSICRVIIRKRVIYAKVYSCSDHTNTF